MLSTPIASSVATAYATCNPENPLREGRDHPYYYDLSPVRGDIPAMQQIRDAILLSGPNAVGESFGATTLLTGHRGNGGHVRDLLRLIRTGVLVARQRKSERITGRVAELAITHFANTTYAKLAQESLRELVALHHTQRLLKAHGHLALHLMVLEYWNQRPWNDLHPCVLLLPEVQEALKPPEPRPMGFSDSPR